MTFAPEASIPPGWYPDPAGERCWRVWTGERWSPLTKPYGEVRPSVGAPVERASVELTLALRRALDVGVVGVLGGLALMVSVLAHWPQTAHPTPSWFAVIGSGVASALLLLGSTACALTVKELRGRWSADAFLPGLNLFVASALASQRLGRFSPWRVLSEIALLVVFCTALHADAWLVLVPALVAYVESSWFYALLQQLSGPSDAEARAT